MADSMRSLNSFGVAGLLNSTAEILYSNDVRARNIGRISDLLTAKLRDRETDEMRLRAILVYGLFLSYAIRGTDLRHSEELPPVSIEVGYDPAYVALGVAFHWDAAKGPKMNGIVERLQAKTPGDPFEAILAKIELHATQLIVRFEAKERKIEVVSLVNRQDAGLKDPTMVIAVDSGTAPLLEVANYTEIGDLDYAKLLKNPGASEEVPSDGSENETVQVVSGTPTEPDNEEIRISGDSPNAEVEELRKMISDYERTMAEMRGTIGELEAKLTESENVQSEKRFSRDAGVADEAKTVVKGGESGEKTEDEWGIGFLKQVWPFKKEEEQAKVVKGSNEEVQDETVTVVSGGPAEEEEEVQVIEGGEAPAEDIEALKELKSIADQKKSQAVEKVFEEIAEEVEENKAKKWVDKLSSELLQEKARLTELQKNLTKQIRQRELEFKAAETSLKQELKKKDELLKSKESAISQKNDQIAQLNLAIERAGNTTNDKESQQFKVRLDRAQRIAQMKEEEAKSLAAKMRDLENRLIIAQAKAQKSNDLQMQTKVQTLEKKVDEYKRINQRLMESLNSQKDKSNDKEIGDLRRKIDQLDRLSQDSKRNLDKANFKIRELQENEKKLQTDLSRSVEENRNLRKNQARSGNGESSGGQAA